MHTPRSTRQRTTTGLDPRPPIFPLLLSSALAVSVIAARVVVGESLTHMYLPFNLVLAWIPYLVSLVAYSVWRPKRFLVQTALGLVWLAFFPNAAYILTDFVHLSPRPSAPLWYDLLMLATFAWTGLFLAVCSLKMMQSIWSRYLGHAGGWLVSVGAIALSAVGIYLGRFERWNSWDLVLRPTQVLADAVGALDAAKFVGFSTLFAAFMLVVYVTFASVTAQRPTR